MNPINEFNHVEFFILPSIIIINRPIFVSSYLLYEYLELFLFLFQQSVVHSFTFVQLVISVDCVIK